MGRAKEALPRAVRYISQAGQEYRPGLMTVIISAVFNRTSPIVEYIFREDNIRNGVKDGYHLVVLYGLHRHATVKILCKTGKHPWTA